MNAFDKYLSPTPGYIEQVYFYELAVDPAGYTLGVLRNSSADKAVALRYKKSDLPCFTQWKNTASQSDGYVTGLEPGTNFPNSKSFERQKGRVVSLAPGENYRCELIIEVCDNSEQVADVVAEVEQIMKSAPCKVHQRPDPRFAPV
jgi:galactose mutarotase-like enzyme